MEIVDRDIPLGHIGRTVGPRPSAGLVRSIRRHGVLAPVLLEERVRDDGTIQYHVIDGNRRVAAARRARCSTVSARVLQGISSDEAARVVLASNSFRASNYVTEFWAIRQLERSGVSQQAISDDTGMSDSVLLTRKLLTSLERRIFIGFAEGRVLPSIALAVARLDRESQRELGEQFERDGRLRKRDVDGMRYRHRTPPSLPEDPVGEFSNLDRGKVHPVEIRSLAPESRSSSEQWMSPGVAAGIALVSEVPDPAVVNSRSAPAVPDLPDQMHESNRSAAAHDLRLALRAIAQHAATQGMDEQAWIVAARDAWHFGSNLRPRD